MPATFQGTARLVEGAGTPSPRPAPFDNLAGTFNADLDVNFELLVGLGFVPVDPSHPAHARYVAAKASHQLGPSAVAPTTWPAQASGPESLTIPFETTIMITADTALRFGLVAPGGKTSALASRSDPMAQQAMRPPPLGPGSGSGAPPEGTHTAGRRTASPPAIGDFTKSPTLRNRP
ncbi:hypothetical protein [Rhizosaccharibacter radicis]|uniref:Uncharacterized protein n=1 Tax=Rhizosaccharibacter radicis TaxID=2782605 RepID=A0ABT1VWJ9_9PROT|nr:hypothetical protein [Acetobacteraceae bacterium KSS12]